MIEAWVDYFYPFNDNYLVKSLGDFNKQHLCEALNWVSLHYWELDLGHRNGAHSVAMDILKAMKTNRWNVETEKEILLQNITETRWANNWHKEAQKNGVYPYNHIISAS